MNDQEGLQLLARNYTYATIREQTGIPESTISQVINGNRQLPEQYHDALTSASYFEAYRELTGTGAGDTSAHIIAGQSLENIDDSLYSYQQAVESYARNWLTVNNRSIFNEEEGKTIFYNLDEAVDKWAVIISKWDVTLDDVQEHKDDTISSDPDWTHTRG